MPKQSNDTSLVILSHSDDEIFLLPYLLSKKQKSFVFVFLVNNYPRRSWFERLFDRDKELEKSMSLLSQHCSIRSFQATPLDLQLTDGQLYKFDSKNLVKLKLFIKDLGDFSEVLSLEYEEGHQDHDFSWFIAREIAAEAGVPHHCFSGYRQALEISRLPIFTVMNPQIISERLEFNRVQCIRLTLSLITIYKSQLQTWVPLVFPTMFRLCKGYIFGASGFGLATGRACLYQTRGKAQRKDVTEKFAELFGSTP